MKTFSSVLLFLFCFFTVSSLAQSEEEMKVWMEYMTPGPLHEWMASSEGDWTFEGKFWMDPASEPTVSSGTMTSEMLLGGRYMQQKHSGTMMGMPFEGINIVAYDNAKKLFITTWIDNMGTGVMIAEGPYNEADKSIKLEGTYFDPMTKSNKIFREILRTVDENNQVMEMYMVEGDDEFKNMEILFTKK
jgi:hypothetical protein